PPSPGQDPGQTTTRRSRPPPATVPGARTYPNYVQGKEQLMAFAPAIPDGSEQGTLGARMTADTVVNQEEPIEKYPPELLSTIPNGTIFAYNLDEKNTAGGMKVRWKI